MAPGVDHVAVLAEAAQGLKIMAGLAQVGLAAWVVRRWPRIRVNVAFALAYGANGVAFAIWNLVPPELRVGGSPVLEWWGLLNWVAAGAMAVFLLSFLDVLGRRTWMWLIALAVTAAPMLYPTMMDARVHGLDLVTFGGRAIYVVTAFGLAVFALGYARESRPEVRMQCAFFGAALAVNSLAHIGAAIAFPLSLDAAADLNPMLLVMGVWAWSAREADHGEPILVLTVLLSMAAPFLAGMLVRGVGGSYQMVQRSGFVGVARLAATGILAHGIGRAGLLSAGREARTPTPGVRVAPAPRGGGSGAPGRTRD